MVRNRRAHPEQTSLAPKLPGVSTTTAGVTCAVPGTAVAAYAAATRVVHVVSGTVVIA
jgi:hypothetical protein